MFSLLQAELRQCGSRARGDMLSIVAERLCLRPPASVLSRSPPTSPRTTTSSDTAALEECRCVLCSLLLAVGIFSGILEASQATREASRNASQAENASRVLLERSVPCLFCECTRYCLELHPPSANVSSCACDGHLCKACLESELNLTYSIGDRVMHCTTCFHEYATSLVSKRRPIDARRAARRLCRSSSRRSPKDGPRPSTRAASSAPTR